MGIWQDGMLQQSGWDGRKMSDNLAQMGLLQPVRSIHEEGLVRHSLQTLDTKARALNLARYVDQYLITPSTETTLV